jgi:DNA-directed RNA polymerase I subunit RPA1
MALGGENPFKAKAALGLKDPIKLAIEKRFHNEGS